MNKIHTKGTRLTDLKEKGFLIPEFIIIPKNSDINYVRNIFSKLDTHVKYILRSNSEDEDILGKTNAGYYLSISNLNIKDLESGFIKIQNDAILKKGSRISIIVQKWICADYSGIAFSREPLSDSYSPIIEWSKGGAEKSVSGKNIPNQIRKSKKVFGQKRIIFEKIFSDLVRFEKICNGPVDIEWLVKKGELFYVQLRPAENKYKFSFKQLSDLNELVTKDNYHYVLGGNSQILMYDNPFNIALLNNLYREDGPIYVAHKKMSIEFSPIQPYVEFNGYLYLDVQKELHQTANSFSYRKKNLKSLKISCKNIFVTFKNIYYFSKLSTKTELENSTWDKLRSLLSRKWEISTKKDLFEMYDSVYEIITTLGLYASHAKINKGPNFDLINLLEALNLEKGNSMDIRDESSTVWEKSSFHKVYDGDSLREIARLLSVLLRKETEIYLKNSSFLDDTSLSRKSPGLISNLPGKNQSDIRLSEGLISGCVIFDINDISKFKNPVLYVEYLNPNLVEFFPFLSGIITKNGGLLSHLSIVAREQNFPVIRSGREYEGGEKVNYN